MKRIKIVGLSLVAVFAMSVVVAASASAESLPRYANCVKVAPIAKKYNGEYANKDCAPAKTEAEKKAAEKDEGKYELTPWTEGEKYKVTITSTASTLYTQSTTGAKEEVKCTKDKGTGEITGEEEDSEVITFEGCTAKVGSKTEKCGTEGKITTYSMTSLLGYAGGKPGTLIYGSGPPLGETVAKFKCGTLNLEIAGVAVGAVTSAVNTCATTITTTYAVNAKHEQELKLWGPKGEESGPYELYTEVGAKEVGQNGGPEIESALKTTEKQKGTLSTKPLCVWTETEAERGTKD